MNRFVFVFLASLFPFLSAGQVKDKADFATDEIKDILTADSPQAVKIKGYLGDKMNLVIGKRIMSMDADYLVEPFRHKDETHLWQSEFWGKWILSAIAAYEYNHDPELFALIRKSATGLMSTQMPDGYIGNYADSSRLKEWDIWGTKYTLLGLLSYYDLTGDKNSLRSACRLADNLLSITGPGKVNIVKTGNYRGMPSSSVLEPMVYLYKCTGDNRYLDFAKYIVEQWETPSGPKLISNALADIPVFQRFPHPSVWWSYDNGQKAYEMMSCYEGLLDLFRITGEPTYLKAVEMAVKNIIRNEINLAGSGTSFECFYNGAKYQTYPAYHTMETCVTMTWMKLCFNLMRLTGDPSYADQIEISAYNALMASLKDDGTQIAKYSPVGGIRHAGEEQCGMHINCCNANGPRAFMMLPRFALLKAKNEILINLYGEVEASLNIDNRNKVTITQVSDYPASGTVEITIAPEKPAEFTIALRIPEWSRKTELTVNGMKVDNVVSGTFEKITRRWNKNDKLVLQLDMSGRLFVLNGCQAIMRGPVVLARDTRFNDGFIYQSAVIRNKDGIVDLKPSAKKTENIWMSFTAPLILGTDLEGEFREPRQISFCDFASAGNTWGEDSRYLVWIPQTINVMQTDYKGY